MNAQLKVVPDGYHTVTPYLIIRDAARAIDFYQQALGAQELFRLAGPEGSVMHAEVQVGDSRLMIAEEAPDRGSLSPQALQGTPVGLFLYVEDADAFFERAVKAGATVLAPLQNMPWGDRFGVLADPFGHQWQVATRIEEVSPEELTRRMAEMAER